ncbi:MAG TPA: SurA N-terminal domain-containing protein [Gammaproteobacteria bacterium]|nr:SurA N-terminal domain-containing protein [Gammaproteobacteria bacterium]
MLDALREGTRGWIAWVIILILVVPFALWGIGNYAGFVTPSYVAEVNGAEITQVDLNKAYRNRIEQLRQLFGSDYVPDDAATLKQQVLDALIDNNLLTQQAVDAGYRVGNQDLVAQIHAMPAFSVGGKFNLDVYRVRLRQAGYTPEGFEDAIRQDLAVRQLRAGIAGSAIATGSEFDHFVALADEQRKIAYVTVKADNYLSKAQPTEAEIEAFYQSHKQSFMTPEKVSIAYIELDAQDIAKQVSVNEQALRSLYQDKKDTFVKQEQRQAAHILIAPKGDGPDALQKAKATAESVLKKIQNGGDFGALAKKYSDDAGSAAKGGELGWVQRGELVEPFEKALFSANKAGAIVGPVKTQYGYHIIKLEGIRQPQQQSFEEVRDQLAADYRQQKAEDKFYKLGSQLSNLAFDHSDSLEPIHKALNLPIEQVKGVTRDSGEGIAANSAVRDAAFSNEVYKNGKNHLVKLGDTHVVVLRDVGHQPAELKPLAAVKPEIVKTLKRQAAAKQAEQVASRIAAQVKSGASLEAAATAEQLEVQAPEFVERNARDVPQPILKAAFLADAPADSKADVGTVALKDGDQAVYVLAGVKPGDAAGVTDQQKTMLMRRLVGSHAQADLAAYVADLRRQADVDIQKDNIDNY